MAERVSAPITGTESHLACSDVSDQGGWALLKKTSEYYEHAQECRELARTAVGDEQRAMLETMAQTWEGLAKDREHRMARKEKIAKLEQSPQTDAANVPNQDPQDS